MASILECSTNAMGTVKVEWKEEDLYGDHDIEWLDVVEVRPIEEKLLDRFDVYVSGGYSCTKASDVAQTTFNTEIGYEDERTRNAVTGRQTYTNTESDSSSSSRWDLSRRVWTDREKLFRLSFASYESNDELGLHLSINTTLYPSLTESGRVRGDGDIRIRWELIEDLFWDVTAYGTYDSNSESEKEFDYGITTVIGWKY